MRIHAPCWLFAVGGLLTLPGCGSGTKAEAPAKAPQGKAAVQTGPAGDDLARCEYKGHADRSVEESASLGSLLPNIRRVYAQVGQGDERKRFLLCREVDTNLDGVKDVVRTFNDKGQSLREIADSNYDGKIDTWITFAGGHIAKVDVDRNGNGQPDEFRFYVQGKLTRVQRDTNHDGRPDVWEIYEGGHLRRAGWDLDFDGRVDRWDRDEIAERAALEKELQETGAAKQKEGDQAGAAGKSSKPDSAEPAGSKSPENKPATGYVSPRKR
jgi:hypothetical protein